jgi:hypothetical protein
MWGGVCCAAGEGCDAGTCVTLLCGAGGSCRAFLTSTEHTGNLGGLAGADAQCQERAEAADLPGTYKAWLSDSTESPATRFTRSSGPYQLLNGTTIATNWDDLTDGTLAAAIGLTETGSLIHDGAAWTNTDPDGTPASATEHCTDWSAIGGGTQGIVGLTGLTTEPATETWTNAGQGQCSLTTHLYCFQQTA